LIIIAITLNKLKKGLFMNHIKRIDRKLMYKGSMLSMYADTIYTPDGNTAKWDYIEHSGAAAVVPVLEDGRILLVRQYRNALDRETLEIPAGGINKGEESITAATRELEEETGYKSDNLEHLISIVTAVAFCDEVVEIYVAKNLTKTQQHLDPDEYIEIEAYTTDELSEMIYSGKIQDSKTIAAIMSYINKK
jgi:ADP-ribose pyrophosphatase